MQWKSMGPPRFDSWVCDSEDICVSGFPDASPARLDVVVLHTYLRKKTDQRRARESPEVKCFTFLLTSLSIDD